MFSEDDEKQLCAYILRMEEVLLGLSRDDVRHNIIAYQMADRNNLKHNFNNETEMAGMLASSALSQVITVPKYL